MIDKKKSECCGCGACSQICPVGAIVMREDAEGFRYPRIDTKKCINCNLCDRVCPFEADYVGQDAQPDIYAGILKEKSTVRKSSSGGAFTALSDVILEQGGKVYGVRFDESFRVKHSSAVSPQERDQFRGSKYVQSDTSGIYQEAEQDLKQGRAVLFSGTPCQIEALNRYMKLRKVNMEKLYTVDNICHGVGSPRLWKEYIRELIKSFYKGERLTVVNMRSKKVGWRKQEMDVRTDQRDISAYVNRKFSWNRFFRTLYAMRTSCFSCKFCSYKRPSDLTLGDFWNFENSGLDLDDWDGVSLILVNTKKGKELFDSIKKVMETAKTDKKASWQIHLEFPNSMPKNRKKFWRDYKKLGSGQALKKYTRGSAFNKLVRFVSPLLRKMGIYTLAAKIYSVLGR